MAACARAGHEINFTNWKGDPSDANTINRETPNFIFYTAGDTGQIERDNFCGEHNRGKWMPRKRSGLDSMNCPAGRFHARTYIRPVETKIDADRITYAVSKIVFAKISKKVLKRIDRISLISKLWDFSLYRIVSLLEEQRGSKHAKDHEKKIRNQNRQKQVRSWHLHIIILKNPKELVRNEIIK